MRDDRILRYNPAFFDAYHRVDAYRLRYPDENVIRYLVSNFPARSGSMKRILDLGCGCGRHLILLRDLGFRAYGIDGSRWAVSYAKRWLKRRGLSADVRVGRITDLPYDDGYFDGLIEHATLVNNRWDDILQTCAECYRVLKKDGVGFFLLKRLGDCAFDHAKAIGGNTYLVAEKSYLSRRGRNGRFATIFRAFSRQDLKVMFQRFRKVQIHTWDMSFKHLHVDAEAGDARTSYWIVIAQK